MCVCWAKEQAILADTVPGVSTVLESSGGNCTWQQELSCHKRRPKADTCQSQLELHLRAELTEIISA